MIERILAIGSYRDGDLEAIVVKNGGSHPVLYNVSKMTFDDAEEFLKKVNIPTQKL